MCKLHISAVFVLIIFNLFSCKQSENQKKSNPSATPAPQKQSKQSSYNLDPEEENIKKRQLFKAIKKGNVKKVKSLIAKFGVNVKNNRGYTALMVAVIKRRKKVIDALIAAKADLNVKDKNGRTALMLAIVNIDKHFDDDSEGEPAFKEKYTEIVKTLITAKANLNIQDNLTEETALMQAIKKRYIEIVDALIAAKANPNIRNEYGQTALMFAVEEGWGLEGVIYDLIAAKADINAKDEGEHTVLMWAKKGGNEDIIDILKKAGAK